MKFVLFVILSVFSFSMSASAQIVGSTALTVSGPTDTSLVLACPSSIQVGPNAGTCTANGNISGSPYTAVWTSNDTSHVTINSGSGVLAGVANGTCASFCIHATSGALVGDFGAITVTTAGSGGLLSGYTVNASNQPSGPIPPGWFLVCADGAEAGPQCGEDLTHTSQCLAGNTTNLGTTIPAHTLTHSYCGEYNGDGSDVHVGIPIPNGSTAVYISYWDRVDPQGMYGNSDYIPMHIYSSNITPSLGLQAQFFGSALSTLTTTFFPHTYYNPNDERFWYNGPAYGSTIDAGTWVQYELLVIPDTSDGTALPPPTAPPGSCTSPSQTGCGNGTLKFWVNGTLAIDLENGNLTSVNGLLSQSSQVHIGDYITSRNSSDNPCPGPWSSTGGGACPGTQPGSGAPKPFFRYLDDIIVLRQ